MCIATERPPRAAEHGGWRCSVTLPARTANRAVARLRLCRCDACGGRLRRCATCTWPRLRASAATVVGRIVVGACACRAPRRPRCARQRVCAAAAATGHGKHSSTGLQHHGRRTAAAAACSPAARRIGDNDSAWAEEHIERKIGPVAAIKARGCHSSSATANYAECGRAAARSGRKPGRARQRAQ